MFSSKSDFAIRSSFRRSLAVGLCALLFLILGDGIVAHKYVPQNSKTERSQSMGLLAKGSSNAQSENELWLRIDEDSIATRRDRETLPRSFLIVRLNHEALNNILRQAPMEFTDAAKNSTAIMTLPLPDGTYGRFRFEESPVMESELASRFPNIKTYRGQGIDDPTATTRFDITPMGFHAIVLSAEDTVYVEPYSRGNTLDYISYYHNDAPPGSLAMQCTVTETEVSDAMQRGILLRQADSPSVISGDTLRTYRLAVGATAEYTAAYGGGTVVGGLAAITTTINFVDAIYEREVAVHLELVANETSIIFTNTGTDGYTHENIPLLLTQNQTKLDTVIGTTFYDIGHVFDGTTLASGFSFQGQAGAIGNVCVAGQKAGGVSIFRSVNPGDVVAYYLVAHEMGHMFGATHTMNGTATGCSGARTASSAYEPGSGSTIMGYRWNCGTQDLRSSDTYFHNASLEQIVAYTTVGAGTCGAPAGTGNTPPTVSPAIFHTIPKSTPFALTTTASDPDGDPVTYNWEEFDLGASSPPDTDADGQPRPILRSYPSTISPTRSFPSLTYILNNANVPPTSGPCPIGGGTCLIGEALPTITRTMSFRVTARDNRTVGGISSAGTLVFIDGTSGPFAVTAPNTAVSWTGGASQTVSWSVNGTSGAPVNAANVKISLSTDGGNTFPLTVLASTPNDGTQTITVPSVNSTTCRIKVEGVGNIFFDVSNVNFTITSAFVAQRAPFDFDGDNKTDYAVVRNVGGTLNWYIQRSALGFVGSAFGSTSDQLVPGDYDGDLKWDIAVWRAGTFYILRSGTGTLQVVPFGTVGDDPRVTQDYDGDGKVDPAVTRNVGGSLTFYILRGTLGFTAVTFGNATTDTGIRGDWDGDGKADVAVYRTTTGTFYVLRSSDVGVQAATFGIFSSDYILPADFDGDGKTDYAVWRGFGATTTGTWYWLQSSDGGFRALNFGTGNVDLPVPGDYDGDGKTDQAVWRPGAPSIFYVNRSVLGFVGFGFGLNTDTPPAFTLQAR